MAVVTTPLRNAYSHISYLVICPEAGEALALDPFDVNTTQRVAQEHGVRITQILSTHEHWDHAGRNEELRARTNARVLASKSAAGAIEKLDEKLSEGDRVAVGSSVALDVLETPGHTMTHISLLGHDEEQPYLLCGDTLFGAGVGNCGYGGHAPTLYETVQKLRSTLSPDTRIYPGHDYLVRNLEFALSVEPENATVAKLHRHASGTAGALQFTTIADETQINPFMRLDSLQIRKSVDASDGMSDKDVFLRVRALRDVW